jgi:hypothetical protein
MENQRRQGGISPHNGIPYAVPEDGAPALPRASKWCLRGHSAGWKRRTPHDAEAGVISAGPGRSRPPRLRAPRQKEKQAEYEAWLVERHGPKMQESIQKSRRRLDQLPKVEREAQMAELKDIEEALAEACRRGIDPESGALDTLLRRHRAWVAMMWDRPCPPEAYAGLADMYLAHPDFRAKDLRRSAGRPPHPRGCRR